MRTVSIATLGTSLTAGAQPWQTLLSHKLREGSSKEIVVYNFGIGASSSSIGLSNIAAALHVRPDIVLIEYSINDAYTPYGISVAQSQSNILAIIGAFRDRDPDVKVFLTIFNPPVAGQPTAADRPNYSAYKAIYASIAASDETIGLIDCSSAWGAPTLTDIPDGIHPPLSKKVQIEFPVITGALSLAL